MNTPLLIRNKTKIFLHVLGWTILLGLPLYFSKSWQVGNDFLWIVFCNTIIYGIIFYTNFFILVPWFFYRNRRVSYFILSLLLLVSLYFVTDITNKVVIEHVTVSQAAQIKNYSPDNPGNDNKQGPTYRDVQLFRYGFTSLFFIFLSMGIRVVERQSQIEKFQKELEKEKLNSELAMLKNQISPHFFFNTLNNIYSLISINASDAKVAVLKLSKMMRYMLYDSENGSCRLSSEIEFMSSYIDLMKLRMNDKIRLSVSFPDKFDDLNIPPLLFIPFIENAFKHGITNRRKSFIDIKLYIDNGSINFTCINSIGNGIVETSSETSGIGLENVSKRLNLLFPGKHSLKINKTEDTFEILLNIVPEILLSG